MGKWYWLSYIMEQGSINGEHVSTYNLCHLFISLIYSKLQNLWLISETKFKEKSVFKKIIPNFPQNRSLPKIPSSR